MNRLLGTLVLVLLSMPVLGESWLCESEYSAQVWHKDSVVQDAMGEEDDDPLQLRVDAEGVRDADGDDDPYIVGCKIEEDTISCSSEDDMRRYLVIDPHHLFTFTGVTIDREGAVIDYIFKGTCKKDEAKNRDRS
jgi:hypothetical protein